MNIYVFQISKFKMPFTRDRRKIKKEIVDELKNKLSELPKTFENKPIENYKWKWVKSDLPHINIDLPIMEVDVSQNPLIIETDSEIPNWTIIKHSCIVVDRKDKRILAVFIHASDRDWETSTSIMGKSIFI